MNDCLQHFFYLPCLQTVARKSKEASTLLELPHGMACFARRAGSTTSRPLARPRQTSREKPPGRIYIYIYIYKNIYIYIYEEYLYIDDIYIPIDYCLMCCD